MKNQNFTKIHYTDNYLCFQEEKINKLQKIDLLKLLGNSIGKGISAISRFIMWFIKFCVKNWYILLVSVAFGIACAFYFSQSK